MRIRLDSEQFPPPRALHRVWTHPNSRNFSRSPLSMLGSKTLTDGDFRTATPLERDAVGVGALGEQNRHKGYDRADPSIQITVQRSTHKIVFYLRSTTQEVGI